MVGPWGWHGMIRGPGLLGGLFGLVVCVVFLAFLALIVWLIVRFARSGASTTVHTQAAEAAPPAAALPPAPQPDPVLEALRRRLAEGAITPEEFDQLREKLGV